jgi:flagellar biosynthesis anti-sigma factor FlgM
MKIDNNRQLQLLDTLSKSGVAKTKTDTNQAVNKTVTNTTDKVELSGWKEEVSRLKEKVKALPDVREDKVATVQQQMKSETYNVNGKLVAKSILKSNLLDEIV